jgi:hypothetical protein
MISKPEWQQVAVLDTGKVTDRFWHAGLSSDGRLCFAAGVDDEAYFVFDVVTQSVVWIEEATSGTGGYPNLTDWVREGHIEIHSGPAEGRYRVFGLYHNYPRTHNLTFGLTLDLDRTRAEVILARAGTNEELQRLGYQAFSGDWAFASFGDDDTILAVLEPYSITLFGLCLDDDAELLRGPKRASQC